MDRIRNILVIIIAATITLSCSSYKTITKNSYEIKTTTSIPLAEKQLFFEYINDSYYNLEKSISGLTEEQLNFKPDSTRWSIMETLEHIVLTEPMLFSFLTMMMEEPSHPELKNQIKTDEEIITGILDRSHKTQAPPMLVPKSKFHDTNTALAELRKNRESILEFENTVSIEDLRNHISDMSGTKVDAYQSMLYIPGHTMRHTLQILEIKNDPNFPKN